MCVSQITRCSYCALSMHTNTDSEWSNYLYSCYTLSQLINESYASSAYRSSEFSRPFQDILWLQITTVIHLWKHAWLIFVLLANLSGTSSLSPRGKNPFFFIKIIVTTIITTIITTISKPPRVPKTAPTITDVLFSVLNRRIVKVY